MARIPTVLRSYYHYQVILKPSPPKHSGPLPAVSGRDRLDPGLHDYPVSSRTTGKARRSGAWGLGWECWCDGMEVSQFTYFQQFAGF